LIDLGLQALNQDGLHPSGVWTTG